MAGLPLLSGRDLCKVLARAGYGIVRQRGSHIRLACPGRKPITIPDHKSIDRSLLTKILRDAELSRDEFRKLLS